MKNMDIRTKFFFLSVLIALIIFSLGVIAYVKSSEILLENENKNHLAVQEKQLLLLIGESLQIGQAIRNIHIDSKDSIAVENLGKATENLNDLMLDLQKSNSTIYNNLITSYNEFYANTKALHTQALKGVKLKRYQIIKNTEKWRAYKKLLKGSAANLMELSQKSKIAFVKMMDSATFQMISAQVVALLLMMIFFFLVNKQIVHSVKVTRDGLLQFFEYLNRERTSADKIELDSKDEFGEMVAVINENVALIKERLVKDEDMVKNTLQVAQRIEEGYLKDTITVAPSNPQLAELQKTFNKMLYTLSNNISSVLSVIHDYTHNNYNSRVQNSSLQGDMKTLVDGINNLGDSMNDTLSQSFESGLHLKYQATILKSYVEQLAHSSNEQAASLEETSSALEQITSNIGSNTSKASTMAIRANEAKIATVEGEALAMETVKSMGEIVDATLSINEAVAIIDNIAFQTNILSLNAAVEAATAGEAGKGFAVVAQEVRSLANKSAEAAKTIQQLTNEAKSRANSGSEISQQMIEGFRKIAHKINETTDLVNDVAYANKEQMNGIEQINDAIIQLDHMTQENAEVANDTDQISQQVTTMAITLSEDAMSKEFSKKDEISHKYQQLEMDSINTIQRKNVNSSPKTLQYRHGISDSISKAKEANRASLPKLDAKSNSKSDDEWETF